MLRVSYGQAPCPNPIVDDNPSKTCALEAVLESLGERIVKRARVRRASVPARQDSRGLLDVHMPDSAESRPSLLAARATRNVDRLHHGDRSEEGEPRHGYTQERWTTSSAVRPEVCAPKVASCFSSRGERIASAERRNAPASATMLQRARGRGCRCAANACRAFSCIRPRVAVTRAPQHVFS